ncbi:MAG: hypothetical protein WD403_08415 [Pirellulales bacterium]
MSQAASRCRWGFMAGLLAMAAGNAISYFIRSDGGGTFLSGRGATDRIGFPLLVWEGGPRHEWFSYSALALNVGCALLASALAGLAARLLNLPSSLHARDEDSLVSPEAGRVQFSVLGLLLATALTGLVLAAARAGTTGRLAILGGVYLFGPALIVAVAYRYRRVAERQRSMITAAAALALVVAAIALGVTSGLRDFTRVLLGIFVFWVPQCTLFLLVIALRVMFAAQPGQR